MCKHNSEYSTTEYNATIRDEIDLIIKQLDECYQQRK